VAIDGVFFRAAQLKQRILMNQAGRYDVQVRCTQAGSHELGGEYGDNTRINQVLMTLVASGAATTNTEPITDAQLAAIVRPFYLADLTEAIPASQFSLEFSQGGRPLTPCNFWLGSGTDCINVWQGVSQPSNTIAGNTCPFQSWPGSQGGNGTDAWNAARTYKHVTAMGQINEWKIYGLGMDTHPLHVHVNHFQIMAYTPLDAATSQTFTDYFQIGEWRDTVPALDGELVVRFRAADFPGETILHCHLLRHEDLGMMSSFYVCDPSVEGSCPPGLNTDPGSLTGGWRTSGVYGDTGRSNTSSSSSSSSTATTECASFDCAAPGQATASFTSTLLAVALALLATIFVAGSQ
jgi:hypothetical protein